MDFSRRVIEVIGVPLDLGANIRGANMGPSELRNAKLHEKLLALSLSIIDDGDLVIPLRHSLPENEHEEKFLTSISKICTDLSSKVHHALTQGRIPLSLGGDHSLAIGSISGASRFFREQNKEFGLIWFDAHADMNTPETSPSGNIHGMPLSVVLGNGFSQLTSIGFRGPKLNPLKTALVGIRSIDDEEKSVCHKMGVRIYTMREIDERGMKEVMEEIRKNLIEACDGIHVSFDLDSVDPQYAPGVSTPVAGGLSYRESHLALEMIADTHKLVSCDFVELNPLADHNQMSANLAIELIQSLFGKNIL